MTNPPGKPALKKSHRRDYRVAAVVGVALLAAGYGIASVVGGSDAPRKRVMETVSIKIVQPPPPPKTEPPPPPPKMVEKPKIQPPIDKPLEAPKPVDAPPPGPLALDAKGGAGSDSFGLGGKPGGSDFFGGGGTRFGHYGVLMQAQIKRALAEYEKLAGAKYRGTVKLRLTATGGITGVEIQHSTGDGNVDAMLRQAISAMGSFSEALPADMPNTVVLRVSSPGAGA